MNLQTQFFCHHADTICHPNSIYVTTKLYETSACGCNNNTIFQNELFSLFLPSTYVAWQRRSLGDGAKVARWRHRWIRHFSCLNIRLCVTTVSNMYNCKVVQWYSMRWVCIAGYCIHFSFNLQRSGHKLLPAIMYIVCGSNKWTFWFWFWFWFCKIGFMKRKKTTT